ncbi:MAG: hypothetical protein QXI54_06710 [Archaeoglobaceae archaeon]
MKKAVLLLALLVLSMYPASAAFNKDATDFAKLMLNNSIAQMQQGLSILMMLNKAQASGSPELFQNLWGVAYGGMVLASINNQVTGAVLEFILDDTNTVDMTDYGLGASEYLYDVVGYAINDLGANADTVFGNPEGDYGLAELLYAQMYVLTDPDNLYDYDYLAAYATNMAKMIYAGVEFFIKLASEIPNAFNPV